MQRSTGGRVASGLGVVALLASSAAIGVSGANAETAPPVEPTERRVLTDEHVDAINVGVDGDRLTVDAKISPPVEYVEVDDLAFQLSDLGYVEGLPQQYVDFIGTPDVWLVPQTQNSSVIWAGWSTENIAPGTVDGNAVDITLTDVQGPGEVEVWQTVGFGDVSRIFSSDEDEFTTLRQSVNAHVHANWAFTQPGVYTLTFQAAATINGQAVSSDPVEYTWVVGGDSGALPDPATSAVTVQAPATAGTGQEVALEASVTTDTGANAPPAPGGYVEFFDGEASLGRTGITEGQATLPVAFDDAGVHEITAVYTPQEPQFYAGSTSEPVSVTVDDAGEPIETTLTIQGAQDAYDVGDPIELSVVQDPPTGLEDYHWYGWAAGAEAPTGVGTGPSFQTEASADLDGTRYSVELRDEDGWVVATAEPVTIAVNEDGGTEDGGTEDGGTEDGGTEDGGEPGQCEDPRTVLTNEHVDLITPILDGSELGLQAKVGTANDHTFYDPADVLVQVLDPEAATTVPSGEEYAFLGEAGEELWLIPQTQNPEVVWAGWSTEELAAGAFEGDAVDLTLAAAEGPGTVEVFQTGGLGAAPTRIFSSEDALDPRHQSIGQHVHANWAFSELGEYTLTFEVSGTLAGGATVTTGEVDYSFVVGDIECDPGNPPGTEDGGAEDGGDAGGAENGGEDGTDGGTDSGGTDGGDQDGGDAGGAENGAGDDGTDDGGADNGGGNGGGDGGGDGGGGDGGGAGPKPTTKPSTDVCVPTQGPGSSGGGSGSGGGDASGGGGENGGSENGGGTENGGGGQSGDPVVLTNEHVDLISPRLEGTDLSLEAKVGSATDHTFYDPANVLVQVKPEAASTVPAGETYAFLGTAGAPLWLIPETQNPEIVWAGWSTEQLAAGAFAGDTVNMQLVGAEGPGTVEVFQSAGFGGVTRIFSSEESLPAREQSVGQHVHANWAFSAEGSYTLTFEVSGTLAGGESVTTGPVEYSFVVGDLAGAQNTSANRSTGAGASPAVWGSSSPGTVVRTDTTPTPTPTPTPSPSSSASPSSSTSPSPSAGPKAADDCDLARTGSSGLPGLAIAGGLLLLGGAGATAAYWRGRRTTPE